jgi:glutamyl-tRNA(Gln) amidotransferase subunit E
MSEYDFRFKPFAAMTPDDYAAVGFRSGLEIHQQLLTDKKLFCRCPAGRYSDKYDAEILRHMRPTLS